MRSPKCPACEWGYGKVFSRRPGIPMNYKDKKIVMESEGYQIHQRVGYECDHCGYLWHVERTLEVKNHKLVEV